MNFLKTGAAVHEAMKKDDLQRAAAFQPFRFWLKKNAETRITFVDGHVEGGLLIPGVAFQEHMLKRPGGGFDNLCCTQESEECPICQDGDRPSLVFALTIIDHTQWKDKEGKTHDHQRRLFVCKGDSFKRLQMKATKPAPGSNSQEPMGLTGVTFNVSRIGEKSPGVGTDFDFVSKNTAQEIAHGCNMKMEDVQPLDYAKVITYLTADELRKLGHGGGTTNSGPASQSVGSADTKALGGETKSDSPFKSNKAFNPSSEL
jgi:hypothetical protein